MTLLLFVKNPVPGHTKTRLAATVGHPLALKMYERLCDWTRDQAQRLPDVERHLYYSQHVPERDAWPTADFRKFVQQGEGLGDRMEDAFARTFAGDGGPAIIIGTDCPGITTEYLAEAFRALEKHDVVVGPALDGGYTLLGMRRLHPTLFRDVEWSTDRVLPTTLDRAAAAGLTVRQLAPLRDVDHEEDWYAYGWTLPKL